MLVRRDNREKTVVSLDELEAKVPELLRAVHDGLYQKALANREARTWTARTFDELKALAAEKSGFFKTMWCGDEGCELRVKEEAGLTSAHALRAGADRRRLPDLRQARHDLDHLGPGVLIRIRISRRAPE